MFPHSLHWNTFFSFLLYNVQKIRFWWIWMFNQFWIVTATLIIYHFIILFRSFQASNRFFYFYNCLLQAVEFQSEEYQHVVLVWWLYHLVLIYFHKHGCKKGVLISKHTFYLVPLWAHSDFLKSYVAYFCLMHVLAAIFWYYSESWLLLKLCFVELFSKQSLVMTG